MRAPSSCRSSAMGMLSKAETSVEKFPRRAARCVVLGGHEPDASEPDAARGPVLDRMLAFAVSSSEVSTRECGLSHRCIACPSCRTHIGWIRFAGGSAIASTAPRRSDSDAGGVWCTELRRLRVSSKPAIDGGGATCCRNQARRSSLAGSLGSAVNGTVVMNSGESSTDPVAIALSLREVPTAVDFAVSFRSVPRMTSCSEREHVARSVLRNRRPMDPTWSEHPGRAWSSVK